MIFDVAIIGAGPVGLFGVFACGMQKLSCIVLDALDQPGGQCVCVYPEKNIYDIPVFSKITGKGLIEKLQEQISPFEAKIIQNSFVVEIEKIGEIFEVKTKDAKKYKAKSIIIASGAGAFGPNRPPIEFIEEFENRQVFYYVENFKKFKNKKVAIVGGGDSAIDWTLHLANLAEKIYLIHRRNVFKAQPHSLDLLKKFEIEGKIEQIVPYQLKHLKIAGEKIVGIEVESLEGEKKELEIDFLLPAFGLKSDFTFLENWNLELSHGKIIINPTTCQTSREGIYAIGDCAHYEHKRKLILSGFAEAAQAATHIFSYVNPDKTPVIGHSTSTGIPHISKD